MDGTTRRRALLTLTGAVGISAAPIGQPPSSQVPSGAPAFGVGVFTALGEMTIPHGVTLIASTGYSVPGRGAACYLFDSDQTEAPGTGPWRRRSANGRWFRLVTADGIDVQALGASGAEAAEDFYAFNAAIGLANQIGSATAATGRGVTIKVPDGRYDLSQGGLNPILVSNLTVTGSQGAILILNEGACFTVGSSKRFIENVDFSGMFWTVPVGVTCGQGQSCVRVENAARVRLFNPRTSRVRRLVHADVASGCIVSNIHVVGAIGTGLPDNSYIDVINTRGGTGADLQVLNANVYPFAPPANVTVVPPAVTAVERGNPTRIRTASPHGLATGDWVRLRDLAGLEALNGRDYVATRIDDTSFTFQANGLSQGSYRGGGYAPKLHWSWPYDTAVISVEGAWDTIIIDGGVQQHWRHLAKLKANGMNGSPISFLFIRNVTWDYGGGAMAKLEVAGEAIGSVWIQNSWHFTLDGPVVDCVRSGRGNVIGLQIENLTVGMAGEGLVDDPSAILSQTRIENVQVQGLQRLGTGVTHAVRLGGANDVITLRNINIDDPGIYYGRGAGPGLSAAVGFGCADGATDIEITGSTFCVRSKAFDIPAGKGRRLLSGNRSGASGAPEYIVKETVQPGPSPFSWTNGKGMPVYVKISGGAVREVALMVAAEGVAITHADGAPVLVGRDQTLVVTYSTPPAIVILPVNS